MARLEGETSNTLFDVLEDWNENIRSSFNDTGVPIDRIIKPRPDDPTL